MSFGLAWKPVNDWETVFRRRKASARLTARGFDDPKLLEVPRESPTPSHLGRNLLSTQCANRRFRVSAGDIRAAFAR